ncbi:hypothetical protein, partial [Xanthomonas graminis]|uniref:hypothetical protein n=1 Tax=Xanthomonas graminis TaxID=3390026 RepID=UPI00147CF011
MAVTVTVADDGAARLRGLPPVTLFTARIASRAASAAISGEVVRGAATVTVAGLAARAAGA